MRDCRSSEVSIVKTYVEIILLSLLLIMTCHEIISLKGATVFKTNVSEILSDLVNNLKLS